MVMPACTESGGHMPFVNPDGAQTPGDEPAPGGGNPGAPFGSVIEGLDPFDAGTVNEFKDGAGQIKSSASEGGFAINEEGMTRYVKMCDTFLDGYQAQRANAERLMQKAKLGSSPFAQQVADFNVKVASDPDTGLVPNLDKMKEGFEMLKESFQQARKNYDENESQNDQYFKAVDL